MVKSLQTTLNRQCIPDIDFAKAFVLEESKEEQKFKFPVFEDDSVESIALLLGKHMNVKDNIDWCKDLGT